MLTLLSPAALWALAALALPLALHLWRRPPRTVRLGSLRFLQTHTGRRVHDLRWRERILLGVRCALLATLAVLLARPLWRSSPTRGEQRWIVVDPAAAPAGSSLDRLRTLQASGYTTRRLPAPAPVDLWSFLHEVDASLPTGSKMAVFSPVRMASLQGIRPALRAGSEWVETPDVIENLPAPTENHKLGRTGSPSMSVAVFHDPERAEDARYLAAAIRTAVEAAGKPLDLRLVAIRPDATVAGNPTEWTFWLSATDPPASIQHGDTQLFQDAPEATDAVAGWIVPQPDTAFPVAPVRLWRRGPAPAGVVFWTDGHGVPLLTRASDEHGTRWRFASRFHPAWTDLPRTTAFPAWMRLLLLPAAIANPADDLRHASVTQARTSKITLSSSPKIPASVRPETHDLHWLFWTAAGCLFVAERLLSHHRRSTSPARVSAPPLAVAR